MNVLLAALRHFALIVAMENPRVSALVRKDDGDTTALAAHLLLVRAALL